MFKLFVQLALILTAGIAAAADEKVARGKFYSPTSFHRLLNTIADKYRRYENDADKQMKLAALKEELKRKTDNVNVRFKSTVAQVKWSRGTASIYTATDPPQIAKSTPLAPIAIQRSTPLYIPMAEAEAAAIKIKAPLTVKAKLSYQDGVRLPLIIEPKLGQPFYDLSSTQSPSGTLGYYTAPFVTVKIAKKTYTVGK